MKYPNLKPCPFCGGAPIQEDHMLRVVCSECGASGPDFTSTMGEFQKEQWAAGSAWNKRTEDEGFQF